MCPERAHTRYGMTTTKVIVAVLAIACNLIYAIDCHLQDSAPIIEQRHEYLHLEAELWDLVENGVDQSSVLKRILTDHKAYCDAILTSNEYENMDFSLFAKIFEWDELTGRLLPLRSLYDSFHPLLDKNVLHLNRIEVEDLAQTILDDGQRINETLNIIQNIMVTQGTYHKIQLEAAHMVCYSKQSPQQVLFNMYNAVSIAELKGYSMMQFSWMILRNYGKGNYTKESHLMRERFEERSLRAQELLHKLLERASREVWRCDPKHHIENETFVATTRVVQGHLENEVDMNKDGNCRENCAAYTYTESYGCFKDQFCARQSKCAGKLLDCQFIDSDMWVCLSDPKSTRRYEFIEYENGRHLGKRQGCKNQETKTDSWWRWIFWHCSYCLCMCDEEGLKSDRYFNLREVVSDIANNKIITGVRLRKVNRIIHIQIQEGVLQQRGYVNASTVAWKPVADYKLLDRGIRRDIDYHTLTADRRAVDLDTLHGVGNTVLTGLRFKVYGRNMKLETQFTEMDFATGKLKTTEADNVGTYWEANDKTPYSKGERRTELHLQNPDVPILSKSSEIDSKDNQFIRFTHSDVDKDVAQTTVPYLDAQDVVSKVPVPLSGAGIYHKGQKGFGGFIGLKLVTYDFAPHVIPADYSEENDFQYVPLEKF